ncbi:MAG: M48 family metalloprotease [bacterium]
MLLPFIPFLIVITGLAVMGALPAPAMEAWSGWQMAVMHLGLLLPGLALGALPEKLGGSRSPMRLSRRRLGLVLLWSAILATADGQPRMVALLGAAPAAEELALIALLANFWLADALCLVAPPPPAAGGPFLRRLARTMGFSLPVVALVAMGIAASAVGEGLLTAAAVSGNVATWLALFGGMALYLALAALLLPVLIPPCWGLRPLGGPQALRIIQDELAANGVSVRRVLNWPVKLTGHATAGVIGLLPRFRFLLIADTLVNSLDEGELRSVTAHEAAHLKKKHLWFFFVAILAFVLFLNLALQVLSLAGLWVDLALPPWLAIVLELGGLLFFLRFGIGFLSRRFERQADGNALLRHGPAAFEGAIMKVALLNGIAVERDNWHHYGIARRVDYAHRAAAQPDALARHDRRVSRLKAACLGALALGLAGQGVFSGTSVVPYLLETFWVARLEQAAHPSPSEKQGLQQLAAEAHRRGDFAAAERGFRLLYLWNPEDPSVQNNLAWILVTGPRQEPGRMAEGLELARSAAHGSASAYIWDTLAEANFRNRRVDEARDAARRALLLAEQSRGRGGAPLLYYRSRAKQYGLGGGADPAD